MSRRRLWVVRAAFGYQLYVRSPQHEVSVDNARAFLLTDNALAALLKEAIALLDQHYLPYDTRPHRVRVWYASSSLLGLEPFPRPPDVIDGYGKRRNPKKEEKDFCLACMGLLPFHDVTLRAGTAEETDDELAATPIILEGAGMPVPDMSGIASLQDWISAGSKTPRSRWFGLREFVEEAGVALYRSALRGCAGGTLSFESQRMRIAGDFARSELVQLFDREPQTDPVRQPVLTLLYMFGANADARPLAVACFRRNIARPIVLLKNGIEPGAPLQRAEFDDLNIRVAFDDVSHPRTDTSARDVLGWACRLEGIMFSAFPMPLNVVK